MTTTDIRSETQSQTRATATVDFKLEVVTLPVTDVDRAKESTRRWAGARMPTSRSATTSVSSR